jgi:DNA-binding CsgD family transcriptional regulator
MTTEMLWEIECRLIDGENAGEIGRALDISPEVVRYWRDKLGIEPSECGRPRVILTIKHAKNGKEIARGTVEECAEKMGASVNYIRQLERKIRDGDIKKYVIERDW